MIHISYTPLEECENLSETYGMICVQCGKCGREFNNSGIMTDDGSTTTEKGEEI